MRSEGGASRDLVPGTRPGTEAGWTTRAESVLAWSRSHSLVPLAVNAACCGAAVFGEGRATPGPGVDDFGLSAPSYAPGHADLLVVGGPLTPTRVSEIRRVHAEMMDPKWVIAYGNCACSGGGYASYAAGPGLGEVLPVDIFIPGCPPRSEALLDGLAKLKAQIRGSGSA
jgi:NADH-quinone oxidoreductase subunit B